MDTNVAKLGKKLVELDRQVIHYGRFEEAYKTVVSFMNSDYPPFMLLHGAPKVGKSLLVKEVMKAFPEKDGYKFIEIHPSFFNDDFAALRYIASELDIATTANTPISSVFQHIDNDISKNYTCIVIVIDMMQQFCRGTQALLYTLTESTHNSKNIKLLGMTRDMDTISYLEKRVRSRLSASTHLLQYPYKCSEEYIEFASLICGGIELEDEVKEALQFVWNTEMRDVNTLKRWIFARLNLGQDNKVTVKHVEDLSLHIDLSKHSLALSKRQLKLLSFIIYYTNCSYDRLSFTLKQLREYSIFSGNRTMIQQDDKIAIPDMLTLVELGFIEPAQSNISIVTQSSVFATLLSAMDFKSMVEHYGEHLPSDIQKLCQRIKY